METIEIKKEPDESKESFCNRMENIMTTVRSICKERVHKYEINKNKNIALFYVNENTWEERYG